MASLLRKLTHYDTAKFLFFLIFVVFLLINWWLATKAWDAWIFTDKPFFDFLKPILSAYSAPLGVILGGIFLVPREARRRTSVQMFATAAIVVSLWNILYTWPLWHTVFNTSGRPIDLDELKTVPELISFLSTGALTAFFVKREQ